MSDIPCLMRPDLEMTDVESKINPSNQQALENIVMMGQRTSTGGEAKSYSAMTKSLQYKPR